MFAVADALKVEPGAALKASTPFCSGMSRTSGICGALTGGLLAVGLALGRDESEDSIEPSYAAAQDLVAGFEGEFGERNCTQLTGHDLSSPEGLAAYRASETRLRCSDFVRWTAQSCVALILERG